MIVSVLCDIRSAHNVGSFFRTADAAGVAKLYLCGITPAPIDRFGRINERIAKVSLGAENTVAWEQCVDAVASVMQLKKEGYRIIGFEQHERSRPYMNFQLNGDRCAIIMGDEVRGIPTGVLDLCDDILEIPMRGQKESLNVSVAFGIAVYALTASV